MRADHRTAAALREVASRRGSSAPSKTRAEDSGLAPPGRQFLPIPEVVARSRPSSLPAPAGPAVPLYTITELANLLRTSQKTIRRMVAARRIPCVRIGRQLRFVPSDVFRWLEARKEG